MGPQIVICWKSQASLVKSCRKKVFLYLHIPLRLDPISELGDFVASWRSAHSLRSERGSSKADRLELLFLQRKERPTDGGFTGITEPVALEGTLIGVYLL